MTTDKKKEINKLNREIDQMIDRQYALCSRGQLLVFIKGFRQEITEQAIKIAKLESKLIWK
jgi:hypothetical protein